MIKAGKSQNFPKNPKNSAPRLRVPAYSKGGISKIFNDREYFLGVLYYLTPLNISAYI